MQPAMTWALPSMSFRATDLVMRGINDGDHGGGDGNDSTTT